jgi:hypothetical protein
VSVHRHVIDTPPVTSARDTTQKHLRPQPELGAGTLDHAKGIWP